MIFTLIKGMVRRKNTPRYYYPGEENAILTLSIRVNCDLPVTEEDLMLQIRLLGQFDVRLDGKRVTISSRTAQSLLAYLALTAGTSHRREKLAGLFWPEASEERARGYLRQELWRIRKAIPAQEVSSAGDYLIADPLTLAFNRHADYWLDVSILERPDLALESLTSTLSLYQGELLPGFYDDWVVLERERIQAVFESKMSQLIDKLVESERWYTVQEQCERWLSLGQAPEPAYRALMLSYSARGDMAKVSAVYQRCIEELQDQFGVEPSAETHALYNGLSLGAQGLRRVALAQPSGTVTFLFTDIDGSTWLLDRLGDRYSVSLAEHHKILRAAIQKWNGREMDTQGDTFFVTFARALDAVNCAAEAQRVLASHPWPLDEPIQVRMGLHTGEPLIASTGYVGMDVHRAARIGDAAHGGQVLLSQTTRDLVACDLPDGMRIRTLGEHRLKDIKFPTPIFQLVMEGLPAEFPPLKSNFSGTEAPTPGEPPFKGLQYFDETDCDLFFGRETLTAKLVERLRDSQFLSVVIGASGSGKSSLVRAGLVPALKKDGAAWQIHVITPTAHPLVSLATELTRQSESVTAAATLPDDLSGDPRSLALFLARRDSRRRSLLVVDQFEELFTLCRDEFERVAFIDNLLTAVSPSIAGTGGEAGCVRLVLTLRADFYAHLAQYPELRDLVAKQQEYIGPMTTEELRRAIEEPARRGHWEFEPGLVDLILRDVGDEPGALPLLSHALLETWNRRAGHSLTLKGYADAGGVHGAIAHTAERVYQDLSSEEQAIARDIFLRLTELGEGTEDTRRRASFEELMSTSENVERIRDILNKLADARLITLGEMTAEVAHEALIRAWPTLRDWLNQDREGLRLHRHLTEAAYEWELLGRDPGALYRGAHLSQAREWAALNPKALNAREQTFLGASIEHEQREEKEREERRQHDLETARKLADTERARAEEQALYAAQLELSFNRAEAQRLALEANRLLTSGGSSEQIALLSLRSMNIHYTLEGDAALAAAARLDYPVQLFSDTNIAWAVAFSPDANYILTGGRSITAKLWDARTGLEIRQFTGHTKGIGEVHFSPDGKHIVTMSADNSTIKWNLATAQEVYRITTDPELPGAAYSHDGKTIFTISGNNTIKQWNAESGKEIGIVLEMTGQVKSIYISPDGKSLLTFSNTAQLWDVRTRQKISEFLLDPNTVQPSAIAFSPDGGFVLTGNTDGIAYLWDVKTGGEVRKFIGHTSNIIDVAFSPDNQYVLTGGGDRTMRLWDMETALELRRIHFSAYVHAIDVSPDGQWVLTSSHDGCARIWSLNTSPRSLLLNQGAGISAVAFSPDGKLIFTGGATGTAQLWDAITGKKVHDFMGHTNLINYGAAFSPDGKYLVTGSWDATIRLWDIQTGKEIRRFIGTNAFVNGVEFSPDGRYVVSAGNDGILLWDAQTGQEIRKFSEIRAYRAVFSPDGNYILTSAGVSPDGKVRLWDVSTGHVIQEYQSGIGEMTSVDLSPDGKYILAGGDSIMHLWDAQTGEELRQFIGHTGGIYTAIFSPDGRYIATASPDNTARLWDVQTGQEIRRFTGHAAGVEAVAFSPDGKYLLTGSDDGTAMLWDVDYHTTMNYLCSAVLRDFTNDERAQYGIKDNTPTCPAK
jgi:WD40 repeat protein/class 3 adenylate cyclase/two-component SAPR family response regulator